MEKSKCTKKAKKRNPVLEHLSGLGFTNRLALYIIAFLAVGLAGGFYLAIRSISGDYTGSLMCWTVVFTPIGTACSVVLSRIVDKSRAENTSASGDGIVYAAARAQNFVREQINVDSPPI
ncbi:MAG TPA: hypothetical protein H9833_01905 [Candidatus Evtepia faecavium]|nr:hypothetical protein [Candidatus Evtepia faecavium]